MHQSLLIAFAINVCGASSKAFTAFCYVPLLSNTYMLWPALPLSLLAQCLSAQHGCVVKHRLRESLYGPTAENVGTYVPELRFEFPIYIYIYIYTYIYIYIYTYMKMQGFAVYSLEREVEWNKLHRLVSQPENCSQARAQRVCAWRAFSSWLAQQCYYCST
jgi:hypothetical protein